MDTGRGDDTPGLELPAHSTGWVARRLRIAPATLRTWHRRYGVGPTGRTVGGHRRYRPEDLDRLGRMRRLILAGLPTAEAARVSADPGSGPPSTASAVERRGANRTGAAERRGKKLRQLTSAAMALDQPVVEPLLTGSLRRRGVVTTWTELILPTLVELGEHYERRGDCIEVEHLFTECARTALSSVIRRQRRWDGYPPALLACPEQEQHSLPLHALGAALAEIGCPCRILGASVPADALVSAVRQLTPRTVFIWAQTPATARLADLHAIPQRRPLTPIVVGGSGWRRQPLPASATWVDSLAAAVEAVSHEFIVSAS
jgi:DNA-binding transcriptional MerR regulator